MLLGIDSGGTFTDFICFSSGAVRVHKVLSSPANPEKAILQGLVELGLEKSVAEGLVHIVHGTTVATNAALENKGVKTLFVTNKGFADLLTIGRQARTQLYELCPVAEPPPVPEHYCIGLNTRVDAQGAELVPLQSQEIEDWARNIDPDVEAVAVCFLFSYLNSNAEQAVARALGDKYFTSVSSEVLPEYGEYERGIATWLNASLGPVMSKYLRRLQQKIPASKLTVMQSSGGTIAASQAASRAVDLLLSGPAGGLAAARFLTRDLPSKELLTLDMGGTSTDVAMVSSEIRLTTEGKIGPYPVAVPMVDMHTIGAGGGSIAYLDTAGMLHVGPESAGADPGPACYGGGGTRPTVTDAHLCLGTLPGHLLLGGSMPLDTEGARKAVSVLAEKLDASIEETAVGIITLANQHMAQALRLISEQRGLDPAGFSLCSFGGAGAMHVCDLAENLGITRAVVPRYSGIFSALGMILARRQREMSRSILRLVSEFQQTELDHIVEELVQKGRAELLEEGVEASQIIWQGSVDCRYRGQSFSLNIESQSLSELVDAFHQKHEDVYGHRLSQQVEIVTLRVSLRGPEAEFSWPELAAAEQSVPEKYCKVWSIEGDVPCFERDRLGSGSVLSGPALVCDESATLWLKPEWKLEVSPEGHLLLAHQSP
jgi:N-methylhydantoinase A